MGPQQGASSLHSGGARGRTLPLASGLTDCRGGIGGDGWLFRLFMVRVQGALAQGPRRVCP